ncbi:Plasma membrane low glucose sensor [Fusarium falciforme]|uniref:Plasma membrane low glucose sensor n=1 Tax=Fusarium falciforme TaxID=195108 RepID=A0A9W8QXA4_9HYPO|nr:Plasma membrane low glucose sensor [Fusarium falciforme]KAJ4179537.1 Plasma membrane low glucose sensor [Fusarium falciforme]
MRIFRKASLSRPEGEAGKTWPAIAMGFFVAFGGVLFGYDTGTISGILAMPYWQRLFSTGYIDPNGDPNITTAQESTIVSILSAGTFFGALSTALFSDYLGRRPGLIIACWIFNLGVVLQTIATAIPMFSAGRFFAGFGVGLVSAMIPLYQSETAPKWIRGAIVGAYQWAITIGLLLAAVVNNATGMRNDTGSYRIPVAVQFAWSLVLFFGMLVLPETPRFLIKKNQPDKAALSLGRIRRLPSDHPAVQAELAEIQASHEYEKNLGQVSYLDCFRPPLLKRQITGMAIQALQQLSGVNFVFYYGTKYFQNSGISNGFIISMVTSAINVASTVPGMYAIDRWGRRPLLLWGAIGMCVSQLIVAVCGTVSTGQNASTGEIFVKNMAGQKASVAFVCIYIFFFASTWGPLPWVVNGEIFPLTARAKGISMSVATNWLFNWAIAFSTPYLVNYGKGYANLQSKIFFVWFGACFLCIFFVYFFVYETKGLSLEEVELLYDEVSVASKSVHWKPSATMVQIQGGQVDGEKVMGTGELSASHHEGKSSESA